MKSIVVRPSAYVAPYVGQSLDPRQVGEELAAGLVLACGFIRTPERMRVTAQLLETASGDILWSDKIDVLSRDLLDVQDEIAERLLAGLKLRLTAEEQQQIERPLTRSPEAYEFYLRGRDALFRYLLRTHDEADLDEAVKMLHEAIGLDAEFARAHATLGRCYVLYAQGWGGAENFVLAERSLKHALAAEPKLVSARLQMVYVDLHHGDKEKARSRVQELLAEQPDDPSVLFVAGMLYRLDGQYDRALATYDRLLEVNPKDLVIVAFNKARVFTHQGRFEEAVAEIDRGRAAEPEHPLLKTFLAVALFNQGMVEDAQALLEDVLRQNPHFDGVLPLLGWCLSARAPARAGPGPRHRPRPRDRRRRPRHRALARRVLRDGGHGGGGPRVGPHRGAHRQRELPAARPDPQARRPARRSALRRPRGGAAPALGGSAGARRRPEMSAPEDLLERIRLRLEESFVGIGEVVAELQPADVADLVNQLTRQEAAAVMSMLAVPRAVEVCDQPTLRRRSAILEQMEPGAGGPDPRGPLRRPAHRDRPRHGRDLAAAPASPSCPPEVRAEVERLLQYPPHSAGGIMTTEFVRLDPAWTVGECLKHVRAVAREKESIYACYVMEPDTGRLLGSVSLRDLVMAELDQPVEKVMRRKPVTVSALDDQEVVASRIAKYNLLAVPVLEKDGSVVGFVTVDDVVDVMIEEGTEDVLKMAAVEAGALDRPTSRTPIVSVVRRRVGWLLLLFVADTLTGTVLRHFEDEIAAVVALSFFIPLLIGTGGNAGSQTVITVIRSLALGEIRFKDARRVVAREVATGLLARAPGGSRGPRPRAADGGTGRSWP